MKINQIKNSPNFNGFYNNKKLLTSLEIISQHGATFSAGVSFISALALRPLAISLTPKADKENKKILSIESVSSSIIKLLIALGISLPLEGAVKKIDENKGLFLKNDTIKNLSNKDYKFLTQTIKMSANLLSSIPKSIFSVALIPIIADLLTFNKKKNEPAKLNNELTFENFKQQVSFKGNTLTKLVSNVIDCDISQNFAKKYSKHDKNITKNISNITDILLTLGSVIGVKKSKKIKDENKNVLISNKVISTLISIFMGSSIDNLIQKTTKNTIENFKAANLNDSKLAKYLEGINIIRPTVIFALVYYGLIPIATTLISDKISKSNQINSSEKIQS